jgi:hypothetical protein
MTSDDSIWVPCPSDLKRNKNIFIIGAQVDRGAFAGSWPRRVSSVHHFELATKILCHFTLGGICCDWTAKQCFRIDNQSPLNGWRVTLLSTVGSDG